MSENIAILQDKVTDLQRQVHNLEAKSSLRRKYTDLINLLAKTVDKYDKIAIMLSEIEFSKDGENFSGKITEIDFNSENHKEEPVQKEEENEEEEKEE